MPSIACRISHVLVRTVSWIRGREKVLWARLETIRIMYATVCTIDSRLQKCWEALIITPWPTLTGVASKCRTTPASPLGRSNFLKQPRNIFKSQKWLSHMRQIWVWALARVPHLKRPPSSGKKRTRCNDRWRGNDRWQMRPRRRLTVPRRGHPHPSDGPRQLRETV